MKLFLKFISFQWKREKKVNLVPNPFFWKGASKKYFNMIMISTIILCKKIWAMLSLKMLAKIETDACFSVIVTLFKSSKKTFTLLHKEIIKTSEVKLRHITENYNILYCANGHWKPTERDSKREPERTQ